MFADSTGTGRSFSRIPCTILLFMHVVIFPITLTNRHNLSCLIEMMVHFLIDKVTDVEIHYCFFFMLLFQEHLHLLNWQNSTKVILYYMFWRYVDAFSCRQGYPFWNICSSFAFILEMLIHNLYPFFLAPTIEPFSTL